MSKVLKHKLTKLRSTETGSRDFRSLLREITFYVGYEATSTIRTTAHAVQTPVAAHTGQRIAESVSLIPVLRAGLGMTDAMLELLPMATVHHIGMYRSPAALLPVQYYNRLPKDREPSDVCFVLEPIIATAGTIVAVVRILKNWGAKRIVVLSCVASRTGLVTFGKKHPEVQVFCAAVDEALTDKGFVNPGLGDAGNRLFDNPDLDNQELSENIQPLRKRARQSEEAPGEDGAS